jgi:hypothetical protein
VKLPETFDRDWVDARVEAYLDGELSAGERARFEALAFSAEDGETDWRAEVHLAHQIRAGLRALPPPVCPPHVARAVLAAARRRRAQAWKARLYERLEPLWRDWGRPALAMTALVLLVVSAALLGRPPRPADDPEVARALAEVQWTLAYLSEVGRETGRTVRHDVLEERVVEPVQDVFGVTPRESPNEH